MKVLEMVLFALYLYHRKSTIGVKKLYSTLFISTATFSLIGVFQFFLGRTTGLFYFLGERSFDLTTPGIALVEIFGRDYIRAYSTFPHPNSLAGFLGVIILLSIYEKPMLGKKWFLAISIFLLCFLLTYSLSAFVSLVLAILILKIVSQKKMERKIVLFVCTLSLTLSLLLPILTRSFYTHFNFLGKKYTERIDLAYISGNMISSRFLQGVGLNTYIVNVPKFEGIFTYSWILQPVHNIFLLVFSETGFLGLVLYFLFFLKLLRTKHFLIFLFILTTGLFDHYWITLQQNILLYTFVVGLSLKRFKL
ncbi:MAG: hypothetical protein UT58_C0006G0017 [Microgenomates group bacterium GW2011_GWC1_39_7b]|nr:MAG: hypothetical protein UT58_C0006G0017 [Microgenomates group bacterium GW2011_GWC1_39_7b]